VLEEAAGFWSYVQADDDGDDGRILSLSEDLRAQYRMQTAEDLELFVDRESIEWGAEWAQRIDDAIAGTTFFIPIITPSYFKSPACRQELLKFTRDATRLGLEQLLMPVYWVSVPELESGAEDSNDEAIRAVAKYQWQDLREERLEDRNSADYRKAVSKLAEEIAKRAAAVTETVHDASDPEASLGTEDEDEELDAPGIIDLLASSEDAMPHLTEILEEFSQQIRTIGEMVTATTEANEAASARGQGIKAALVNTEKLARQLEAPTGKIEELGRDYAATLAELDPGIHARLDLIAESGEREDEHRQFLSVTRELAQTADEALGELETLVEGARSMAKLSRSLRSPLRRMQGGLQGVLDGRAILEEWGRRATELEAEEQPDPAPASSPVSAAEKAPAKPGADETHQKDGQAPGG
jgi:hypothetical protein